MATWPGLDIRVVPEPKPVKRSWKERLLSLPWRPWVRFKMETHPMWDLVNGNECWRVGDVLYVSVRQFHALKEYNKSDPWVRDFT